jgi:hypothetical protein
MATQPKPKPKPEPEPPEPKPEDDAVRMVPPQYRESGLHAVDPEATEGQPPGLSLLDRVENLEHRMTALEERVAAPPIGLGRRP